MHICLVCYLSSLFFDRHFTKQLGDSRVEPWLSTYNQRKQKNKHLFYRCEINEKEQEEPEEPEEQASIWEFCAIKFKITLFNTVYPVDNPVNPPLCPNPPCATAMSKVVPSSGNAQEATSPPLSDFEKALENLSPSIVDAQEPTPPPPSTLPTGRVEVKALENLSPSIGGVKIKVEEKGRQQELARKTLDKEYVQSKKHGYATNLWTAQLQGTPGRSGSSGRLLPPRAFTNRCAAYVTATFGTGLVCMCVYVRARVYVCSEGIDASCGRGVCVGAFLRVLLVGVDVLLRWPLTPLLVLALVLVSSYKGRADQPGGDAQVDGKVA